MELVPLCRAVWGRAVVGSAGTPEWRSMLNCQIATLLINPESLWEEEGEKLIKKT